MTAADWIRSLLWLDIVAMALMALFYLRSRGLPWSRFLVWGLLAVMVPIFGPFLVIALRPGAPRNPRRTGR